MYATIIVIINLYESSTWRGSSALGFKREIHFSPIVILIIHISDSRNRSIGILLRLSIRRHEIKPIRSFFL